MQNFFTPKSIAVIGVSKEPNKVGHIIFKNLYQKFKTFPVNPKEKQILGQRVYASVKEIPRADLAIIAIPVGGVIQAVHD